ncbi:MAG TPA: DUF5719 family protein [Nocardioides sp.]|uniref:DUF5719 family protein n=1 Tax=Nocardioides sp. TaxID=35761 RepID=UPI002F3E285A
MSPGKRVRMGDVVRRRRTPRLDAVSVLAVVIPLVTVGVLAMVRQPPVHDRTQPPALTRLTSATVVCPARVPGSPDAWVSTASGGSGDVSVRAQGAASSMPVRTGAVARVPGTDAPVVVGRDALAPGLLGLRSGTSPLTYQACSVPSPQQWFTGLGAGAEHDSVIELVNPDSGSADADITLYGSHPFTARKLHGITIPAHRTISLDLGRIVPRRMLLSAQVQVTRGRLAVHVLDSRTNLLTHQVRREWLPRQDGPAADSQLLGLPTGKGTRTLQLANPGEEGVRVQVKIVTGDTSFAPAGLDTVTVPAGATRSVSLTKVLAKALGDGAVGVQVTADGPVTASVLTDLGTDQAFTVPDPVIRDQAATLLPVARGKGATPVTATLYVAADSAGAATVSAYDASGKKLLDRRVGQQQGLTAKVPLPKGTAFLEVVPESTRIRAAVLLTGDGASVVPMHELLTRGLVPQISLGQD